MCQCSKKKLLTYFCACVLLLYLGLYYSLMVTPCERYSPRNILSFKVSENYRQKPVSFFNRDNPYFNKEWELFHTNLARYKIFHKQKLAEIKLSKDGDSVKTLTWSCSQDICKGMGDQLFRIQFFLLLAMMSDRLFLVQWDSRLNQSAKYILPGEIDWSYYDETKGICGLGGICNVQDIRDSTSNWDFGWTKHEYVEFGKDLFSSMQHIGVTGRVLVSNMYLGNLSIVDLGPLINQGMEKLGITSIFSNTSNNNIYAKYEPLWYNWMHRLGIHKIVEIPEVNSGRIQMSQSWLYFSHFTFTYLFRFPHDLIDIAEQYKNQLNISGQDYLSLHMRTGFMGTTEQERYITMYINSGWKIFCHEYEWHCIIKHAIELRNEILGSDKYIYMSTDSQLVRELVDTVYADDNIVYGNFGFVHSANQKSCGINKGNPAVEGYLATWLDFYLMGNAKFIVHSYSSYAVNSAFLKPIPHAFHSWVLHNNELDCLASHRPGKTVCIC